MTDRTYEQGFTDGTEQATKVAAIASSAMESMHRAAIDSFAASVANMTNSAQRQIADMVAAANAEIGKLRAEVEALTVRAEAAEAKLAEDSPGASAG